MRYWTVASLLMASTLNNGYDEIILASLIFHYIKKISLIWHCFISNNPCLIKILSKIILFLVIVWIFQSLYFRRKYKSHKLQYHFTLPEWWLSWHFLKQLLHLPFLKLLLSILSAAGVYLKKIPWVTLNKVLKIKNKGKEEIKEREVSDKRQHKIMEGGLEPKRDLKSASRFQQ